MRRAAALTVMATILVAETIVLVLRAVLALLIVLTGLLDRSALYGMLAEIDALGLDLLEVLLLEPDRESPVPDGAHP